MPSPGQEGMPATFLANAITNADQLRRSAHWLFALSQIFVTSITTVIWNGDMIPFEQLLINDAFTNYRKILGDVTLNPAMGEYLDMANNAKADPAAGTVANENYAREVMQLFSMGDVMPSTQDGSVQTNATGPIPAYFQTNVTELARVFTDAGPATQPAGQSLTLGCLHNPKMARWSITTPSTISDRRPCSTAMSRPPIWAPCRI